MKLESLEDLFVEQLRDLYNAEQQLVKALPKLEKAATAPELKKAFREHLQQTKQHVERLKTAFAELELKPGGETCEAMQGLVKEGEEVIKAQADDDVRDAALIAAAQRVEHYEISGYGTARTFAVKLGRPKIARQLQITLNEEGDTDRLLTEIAESTVNESAATS